MTPSGVARARSADAGSAALLAVLGGMVLMAFALAVVLAAADYGMAAARAAAAADAAALAAMAESPLAGGRDNAASAAAQLATANGAQLDSLDLAEWPFRVSVNVSARPSLRLVTAAAPAVPATAAAAVRPP